MKFICTIILLLSCLYLYGETEGSVPDIFLFPINGNLVVEHNGIEIKNVDEVYNILLDSNNLEIIQKVNNHKTNIFLSHFMGGLGGGLIGGVCAELIKRDIMGEAPIHQGNNILVYSLIGSGILSFIIGYIFNSSAENIYYKAIEDYNRL